MEEQERSREGPASARGLCQAGTQTDPSLAVGGGGGSGQAWICTEAS